MSDRDINELFSAMSIEEVKTNILTLVERYFPIMEESEKQDFVIRLLGKSGHDKLSSMVNR
ncbi:MAG: hypothetical protein K9N10_09280 [Deltaproteobacteria bacterium]|nr:hypothetical protein [Deltaproteobacteria bacterium]